ncbi:tail fiber domain-containing protein [Mesohalobacter halotolerans]|uniref:T9SS type A sorting domain-containing protein n=1 Tax=Mesohalobacter halotolerans TaxID=1883405 RepID=A0A4U5TQS0_9FLAO|nr:tail fiber domain-containing protein [Mesohalobacter halotolerans]TKS56403.1 T9SS type A sorting domain-containing protein [Mesohalobacter halotolerans]
MKIFHLFTILFMTTALSFGQNQSFSLITDPITPASTIITGEVFRFDQGLVTQLNNGPDFNFSNARWFSIGELNTGSQDVFGLRFQLPRRGVIFGYQDINDDNPRIQWIDDREEPGSLEFRFANDTLSTSSTLVANMTNNAKLVLPAQVFGPPFIIQPVSTRLTVANDTFDNGIFVTTSGSNNQGNGIFARSTNNANNVAVRGLVTRASGFGSFAYGIFGDAPTSFNSFAGFFDGNVNVTGTITQGSDRKLKDDLKESENVLENLSKLKAYTYKFKDNDNLNLPKGLQHGLIAQEVEKVYPELVQDITYPIYNEKEELVDTDTYKSVNYIGLISELTAAMKELNAKVKELESQVEPRVVYSSKFTASELENITKNAYKLEQNRPNPFSESTIISYALPEDQNKASILVFDLNSRMLKSYDLKNNNGELKINATDLNGSGMYLYTLYANGEEIITKRMILK